ncbi:MAG: hypothetical protein JWP12_305 [Bacteroidetes bacterium]|nr:hypothetical protein [Bacteroidota bacterium]
MRVLCNRLNLVQSLKFAVCRCCVKFGFIILSAVRMGFATLNFEFLNFELIKLGLRVVQNWHILLLLLIDLSVKTFKKITIKKISR